MGTRPARSLEWMQALPPPSKELPLKQWGVLHRLALAMGKDGSGWVSVERLADQVNVSVATVKRATTWARAAKLLEQTSRGHRITAERRAASTYQLLLPTAHTNEPLADWDSVPTAHSAEPTAQNGEPTAHTNEPLKPHLQSPTYKAPDLSPPNPPAGGAPRTARQNATKPSATQPNSKSEPPEVWHTTRAAKDGLRRRPDPAKQQQEESA